MSSPLDDERRFLSAGASPVLLLRVLLIAIALSTALGLTYAVVNREAFEASFPGTASPAVYGALLLVGVIGYAALAGLWFWRRWAVFFYGVIAAASLVLDLVARAPAVHQITVVTGALLIFALVYLNWDRFRERPSPDGG